MTKETTKNKSKSDTITNRKRESFVLDRFQLREFIKQGHKRFVCYDGKEIEILFHPCAYQLESGVSMPSEDTTKEDEYALQHFFDYPRKKEKSLPLIEVGLLDDEMTKWMIDHLNTIEDVIGFPLQNVKVKEEARKRWGFYNHVITDIYAEDIYREKVVMSGDRNTSKNSTLVALLSSAILTEATKMIWVANEIMEDHQIIVKWLNEYFSKRINIYLVEAKCVPLEHKRSSTCQFRLVESPSNGWINH
jgi:hypothetical protein